MIIGLIVKNYKCYKGIKFIPFIKEKIENMRLFIGNNGVGKSAVLEAMDTFFNNAEWTVYTDAHIKNKDDCAVAVVFLMDKEKTKSIFGDVHTQIIENISNTLWNLNKTQHGNLYQYYSEFFNLKDSTLQQYRDTNYLFIFGNEKKEKDSSFISFKSVIENGLKTLEPKPNQTTINTISAKLKNHYSYLYIPVESSISEFLQLEARGIQVLMDKTIKEKISDIFEDKNLSKATEKGKKQYTFLEVINTSLEEYVTLVEKRIQEIDKDYNFNKDRLRTSLTANHITDTIIDTYYTKRKLKKGKKLISTLSSGEKRRALIDVIFAFIKQSNNQIEKELILAIDEPESSLHISKCYEQFERVQDIALNYKKTVFLATHWYGSLPILELGTLIHIDETQQHSVFSLSNYFEERGYHPDDIYFKSYFDLSSSILSSLRNENSKNWLLVEGNEDKQYLEYYLDTELLNLKILPLGGCSIVKKLYEYLYVPISTKSKETNKTDKKVFCLIDTDLVCTKIKMSVNSETDNELLIFRRLQADKDYNVQLYKIDDTTKSPTTEIEESLEPKVFYDALTHAINENGTEEEKSSFGAFDFDNGVAYSRIEGDNSILSYNGSGKSSRADKDIIRQFVKNNKALIASKYVQIPRTKNTPKWIKEIETFF